VLHPPIEVGDVPVPAIIDRGSIVVSAGDDRVELSDQDHWAAPLDALIRQALSADLTTRLPSGSVLPPGGIAPHSGVRVLSVQISRFMGDTDGNVVLTASWALLRGGSSQVLRTGQEAIHGRAASGQIAAIVPAMSAALGQFADRAAAQVER
jgi:uncharacterized lipoprotein YmbA